ncbi:MAG: hypothetical protein QM579_08065 [Desulfovibrio sp.]|uniref:hyaluronate lyase N-terminal domain-containing protein n=1 Tax=Desulfovibrio sp. TaxID=885 RepID=UPI0039E237C4
MSTAVQRRRGTTAQHLIFAGLPGEITVDTEKKTLVVHDGTTMGGTPLAKAHDLLETSSAANNALTAANSAASKANEALDLLKDLETGMPAAFIGLVFAVYASATYVPGGCVVPDGAEYTRAQFPTFYDDYLATGKILSISYSSYAGGLAAYGNCGCFALDRTTQKFRVPFCKDGDAITVAASNSHLGSSVQAGAPNILAQSITRADAGVVETSLGGPVVSGAFKLGQTKPKAVSNYAGTSYGLDFDASLVSPVYKNAATTITTESIQLRHFVVLASAYNSSSMMDWSAYMDGLSGKVNRDLSNLATAAGEVIRSNTTLRDLGTRTTAGTWTLTGVIPHRALILGCSTGSASLQRAAFRIISGSLIGKSTYSVAGNGAFVFGRTDGFISAPSCVFDPTDDTVVIEIGALETGVTLYARQI